MDTLDLVQLHCPETPVLESDAAYDALDTLVDDGRIAAYGVSVETCDQALTAIARPHVASVQIILNAFRQKPIEAVLPAAAQAGVGIIARVPLASGLLSGRYTKDTVFAEDDHRTFNRMGKRSTSARPSPGWTSPPASMRRPNSASWHRTQDCNPQWLLWHGWRSSLV